MELALSGRTFEINRHTVSSTADFRAFAEIASRIGYSGVDLRKTQMSLETSSRDIKERKRILHGCGLHVVRMNPTGYPVLEDTDLFLRYLDLAASLDCRSLRMSGNPEASRRCADMAQRYGIRIGPQNHVGSDDLPGPTETIDNTVAYLKRINHPNVGLFYDPAHLFVGESEYGAAAVERVMDSIIFVQLQALVEIPRRGGEGTFCFHQRYFIDGGEFPHPNGPDFQRVLSALRSLDYDGCLCVFPRRPLNVSPQEQAETYYREVIRMWSRCR